MSLHSVILSLTTQRAVGHFLEDRQVRFPISLRRQSGAEGDCIGLRPTVPMTAGPATGPLALEQLLSLKNDEEAPLGRAWASEGWDEPADSVASRLPCGPSSPLALRDLSSHRTRVLLLGQSAPKPQLWRHGNGPQAGASLPGYGLAWPPCRLTQMHAVVLHLPFISDERVCGASNSSLESVWLGAL